MKKLGLQDRDIDSTEFAPEEPIDYEKVNCSLEKLRSDSEDILKKIIAG